MLRIILSIILFFVLLIVTIFVVNHFRYRPTSSRYITGFIDGEIKEKINTEFTVRTFNQNGNRVREEVLDVYNLGYFTIEFHNEEKSFFVYESSHSYGLLPPGVKPYSTLQPRGKIDIDEFNRQKIRFVQTTVYKEQ